MPLAILTTFIHAFGDNAVGFLRSAVAFVVVLGILVFFHELGHYLAARLCRMRVDIFSIGFGRAIVSWRDRVGTDWKIGWLPLGGYVRLRGLDATDDELTGEGVRAERGYWDTPVLARMFVVAAGPIANFILAVVVFAILFAFAGVPVPRPDIGGIVADSPASRSGLMVGDQISAIGDQPVKNFNDIKRIVETLAGKTEPFHLLRKGAEQIVPVTLGRKEVDGRAIGFIGISGAGNDMVSVGPVEAVKQAGVQTWDIVDQTVVGLWRMISKHEGAEELGGPLRIAQLSGQVARLGIASVVAFVASLSVNLGLVNLFPIPMLDGGYLVFYIIEIVAGRHISTKCREYAQPVGMLFIGAVFLFVTWNDLVRLHVPHWFGGILGH